MEYKRAKEKEDGQDWVVDVGKEEVAGGKGRVVEGYEMYLFERQDVEEKVGWRNQTGPLETAKGFYTSLHMERAREH